MVEEDDSDDLLECYSDPKSVKIFNSDNCTSDFLYKSSEEVKACIECWIEEFKQQGFVRFSIVHKEINKAIGTIEMFAKEKEFDNAGRVGVLRLDLASYYEKDEFIREILEMIDDNLFADFEVDSIITKAIPEAIERTTALKRNGYEGLEKNTIVPYDNYYMKNTITRD